MQAYQQALASNATPQNAIGASRTRAGSLSAMIIGYLNSAAFHNLAPTSQTHYRGILEALRREHGDRSIADLRRNHVIAMLDAKAATPVAARNFLRCLRVLIRYGIDIGVRQDDPTQGVRVKLPKSEGFKTWSEENISQFEAHYPVGSKPRLALALLLNTAGRVSDVIKLGRGNVRSGVFHFTSQKTGKPLQIPITAEAAAAINAGASSAALVFLLNEWGRPFTPRKFSKWFIYQCRRIGLRLSAHGLRKAACRRLAEAGASANEIAAISGHASLNEVARYTRAVDQAKMAANAMAKMVRDKLA
jgi:integrase